MAPLEFAQLPPSSPRLSRASKLTASSTTHCRRSCAQSGPLPLNRTRSRLTCLFAENPTRDFAAMGFPDDWQQRPLWAHLCSD